MIAAWALVLGGLARVAGEIIELLAGRHTGPSGLLAALGLLLVVIGFTGLWTDVRTSRLGRAAVILIAVGALVFVGVAIWSVSQGTLPIGEVARTPQFIGAAATTFVGALCLAAWLVTSSVYPRWIGLVMSAAIGLSLVSSFVALPSLVQPLIDMVMALTFIQLGLSMAERRKRHRADP
ncbi:hypothetical protein SAMN04487974_101441 [Pelagibacterium luteolum]|uniref:Uncharacterized protein n=2 Tax=Pelagibacterium luteolum TaxID=440168 RepID=A0A1G7SD07_9HYPH|nr:hypothetical protein SAMN04487974_101441 [Pelagibacterium luteolum]